MICYRFRLDYPSPTTWAWLMIEHVGAWLSTHVTDLHIAESPMSIDTEVLVQLCYRTDLNDCGSKSHCV